MEAFELRPLRSATVLSLVFAAFSSFRLVVRERTISSWPVLRPKRSAFRNGRFLSARHLCVRDDGRVQHGLVFDLAGCTMPWYRTARSPWRDRSLIGCASFSGSVPPSLRMANVADCSKL